MMKSVTSVLNLCDTVAELQEENKRLKAELKKGQWVKCSERLPEKPGRYLVAWKSGDVECISFMKNFPVAQSYWPKWRAINEITHWRELPENPKE